jgi:osmotically-inducible protein OsmY
VVDEDERLVGIVARADVVRAFASSDEEIAGAVRDEIERILGLDLDTVHVDVAHGDVVLSGEVDTEANAKLAAFFASLFPGVVSVRSNLRVRSEPPPTAG